MSGQDMHKYALLIALLCLVLLQYGAVVRAPGTWGKVVEWLYWPAVLLISVAVVYWRKKD